MFVSGKIRGNAPQLGSYLLKEKKNQVATILSVNGRANADQAYLKDILYSMELNSELTKTRESVYHSYISPDYTKGEDRAMTLDEWNRSVEITAKSLKMENQRSIVVLHEDTITGRIHAHLIIERYDHERGIMIDRKDNFTAHDKARFEMEQEFGHDKTPQKNVNQPKHKKTLTQLWLQTSSGAEFIKQAYAHGYQVAKGTDRPFRVVDQNGTSFDLLRQLDGIKTKEVRTRLTGETLVADKDAIKHMAELKMAKMVTPAPKEMDVVVESVTPVVAKEPVMAAKEQLVENKEQTQQTAEEAREQARKLFIENLKAEKERNMQRSRGFRDMAIAIVLALQVSFSWRGVYSNAKEALLHFKANKGLITNMTTECINRRAEFIEASKFYKPT